MWTSSSGRGEVTVRAPVLFITALVLAAATSAISGARHGLRPLVLRGRRITWSTSSEEEPAVIHARLLGPAGASFHEIHRTGRLTPYTVQTIAEDAIRMGRGARLEVTVAATNEAELRHVRYRFARLANRGIHVQIRRDVELQALGQRLPRGAGAGDDGS